MMTSALPPKEHNARIKWLNAEMRRCWDVFSRPLLAARGDVTQEDIILQDSGVRYAHQRYHQLAKCLHELCEADVKNILRERVAFLLDLDQLIVKAANA